MNVKNSLIIDNHCLKWDKCVFLILLLNVILLPIAFYPYSIPVFDPIKNLIFQLTALIGLAFILLRVVFFEEYHLKKSSLDVFVFIYILYMISSLFWTINVQRTILALPFFLAGPIVYFLVTNSMYRQKDIHILLFVIVIMGTGLGIYGILQYLGIDFEFWTENIGRNKVFGLFGNVNYFAEYIILPLSLTLGLIFSKVKIINRFFLFFAAGVMGVTLFLTFTRGSYLGVFIAIPIVILCYYKSAANLFDKQIYKKLMLCFILVIIIATTIIYIPHPLNRENTPIGKLKQRITIESLSSGSSILRRVAIWKSTWMMIKDYPLFGSGLGTYGYNTLKYQAQFFAQRDNREIYPHGYAVQAHNEYLQMWSEIGIIGLLLFLSILFIYCRNILINLPSISESGKSIVISLMGGIMAVLLDAIFGFPLQLAASSSLFWMFIGLTNAQIIVSQELNDKHGNESAFITGKVNKSIEKKFINNYGPVIKKTIWSFFIIVLAVFTSFLLIKPFMSRVYWYYGNEQIALGNYNKGIKLYEKGLKWNPWQGEMYFDIGNILASKDINQLALEYLLKAEKYVDHHRLPQNIAVQFIKVGETNKAIPYLERGIEYQENKKNMEPLLLQLGNLYLTAGEYNKAVHQFERVTFNNSDSAEAYYGLAGAYLNQDKKEKAIEALKKVIEISPESKISGYSKTLLINLEAEK
ncbi:MAG: tetratricopeptide repeat protein [Candidatus Atribacteria bacterium]|nr:tetratricopeptide repeat protein [Candidatus Atribacteria bacterium]